MPTGRSGIAESPDSRNASGIIKDSCTHGVETEKEIHSMMVEEITKNNFEFLRPGCVLLPLHGKVRALLYTRPFIINLFMGRDISHLGRSVEELFGNCRRGKARYITKAVA